MRVHNKLFDGIESMACFSVVKFPPPLLSTRMVLEMSGCAFKALKKTRRRASIVDILLCIQITIFLVQLIRTQFVHLIQTEIKEFESWGKQFCFGKLNRAHYSASGFGKMCSISSLTCDKLFTLALPCIFPDAFCTKV